MKTVKCDGIYANPFCQHWNIEMPSCEFIHLFPQVNPYIYIYIRTTKYKILNNHNVPITGRNRLNSNNMRQDPILLWLIMVCLHDRFEAENYKHVLDSIKWCHLTNIRTLIVEIRRSQNRLITTNGHPILVKRLICIKSARCFWKFQCFIYTTTWHGPLILLNHRDIWIISSFFFIRRCVLHVDHGSCIITNCSQCQ